ncbi:MAG: alpha/beta fold hydrolase [Deltaproteobacteria bacterium]|nr:alpha/beta fold hydrolase [Deltaproteobacteria bacterium]
MDELLAAGRDVARAWLDASGLGAALAPPPLAQTPRDELPLDGGARLLHFHGAAPSQRPPILLVPSMINRWYVLDLRPGASLVEALVRAGFDVWCLDWGVPEAEDRYLDWDAALRRLARAARRVARERGVTLADVALLGYCMGGTLTVIHAAQHAPRALVTLAAPIDFSRGGALSAMVDTRWFDAGAIADAGNVAPAQMQAGFTALRPTLDLAKLMSWPALATDGDARAAFFALEAWASDNIPFPAEAYRRYIAEMYQGNQLVAGTHRANGRAARLADIRCPTLVITASRDPICPPPAALALLDHIAATDKAHVEVAGGHVGAVVGSRAAREMYPALASWLATR